MFLVMRCILQIAQRSVMHFTIQWSLNPFENGAFSGDGAGIALALSGLQVRLFHGGILDG